MTSIVILVGIAIGLLIYQQFFYENPDELDERGNPVRKKKKK